jgi:peptidoglycan-associated lipoprotein
MKLTKFANLLVIGLALTVSVSACKKKPYGVTPIPGRGITGPGDVGPGNTLGNTGIDTNTLSTTGFPQTEAGKYDNYIPDAEIFKSDTIYFAFDSSVVRSGEKSKAAKVADHLKSNSADALRVEGHCDERGTEEYNRALGERRALAVREELAHLGVDPGRVVTVTFGKDRPAESGHNEAAWSKNRRAEFILLRPPK